MRSSESIESQLTFLKLFGSGILGVLKDDYFLNKTVIFRSSPGGGKTSLFRLFSSESLREISQHQSLYHELAMSLNEYGVLDENGPTLLGIYLKMTGYGSILDLDISNEHKRQYLFASIAYRSILKALLGVLTLNGLDVKDLERITISKPIDTVVHSLKLPCNGKELYEQASAGEQEINKMITRFDVTLSDDVRPLLDFEYLKVISPENILLDGKPVVSKTLIMLDDLHKLRKPQRVDLFNTIIPHTTLSLIHI